MKYRLGIVKEKKISSNILTIIEKIRMKRKRKGRKTRFIQLH
jgi:hypothetical protein